MSKAAGSQDLPQRYALIFKQLVRFYETKQYKKGLRAAEQILKAQPDHGETLAMKGLILNYMGPEQQSQALPLIKKGLLANMQSHICWHVLGLYHRAAREYGQAIKAYLRALHIDPDNIQILRDLSLLQVQIRDLVGYEETRRRILVLQPGVRHNWLAYSVSACLGERRQRALDILAAYQKTLDQDRSYEYSEMVLFQLRIMLEEGLLSQALQFAQYSKRFVVDTIAYNEIEADLLLKLGRHVEAKDLYRQLIDLNPDQASYHAGWQAAASLDESSLLTAYDEFVQEYPTANLPKLLPLQIATDMAAFTSLANQYLRFGLERGVPCLFRCIRQFYSQPEKREAISGLIIKFATMEPSVQAMLLYAEHFDYIQEYDQALKVVDRVLESPAGETDRNCIDMLMLKSRILKHMGAFADAHAVIDQARRLDLQDRYLNTKTVKFALRAGLLAEAENVVSLFLRDGDTIISLFDMQCMWYELAVGEAHAQRGSYGPALKKFNQVGIHFNDIADDQFDFHSYCLRRQTLSVYVSMLKWEDSLRSHRFAVKSAVKSAEIFLNLHCQSLQPNCLDLSRGFEVDARQAKREAAKARRVQNKASKELKDDSDPQGESFLKGVDYLSKARDHVHSLAMFAPSCMDSHILSAQLYTYLNLPLRILHSLLQAAKLPDAMNHHAFQIAALRFAFSYKPTCDIVRQIVSDEIPSLFPPSYSSPTAYSESLICRYASSDRYEDRVHVSELMSLNESSSSESIRSQIMSFELGPKPSLSALLRAKAIVNERFKTWSSEFNTKARILYPLADVFKA